MKKVLTSFFVLVMLLLPAGRIVAQVDGVAWSALSSGGKTDVGGGLSVSYTIGQAAFGPVGGVTHAGFQQVFCITSFDTIDAVACLNSDFATGDFKNIKTDATGQKTYTYKGVNRFGCDSVVYLNLTVLPTSSYTIPLEVCQGASFDTYGFDSVSSEVAGKFEKQRTLQNVNGCDSVVTLKLNVLPAFETTVEIQASGSCVWNGKEYTESTEFDDFVHSTDGSCDTIKHVKLAIMKKMPLPTIYSYNDRILIAPRVVVGGDTIFYPAYRWYRDGNPITSIIHDNIVYQPLDDSKLDGCYYLEVATDETETAWVKSNLLCLGKSAKVNDIENIVNLSLRPNPITSGQTLYVSIDAPENLLAGASIQIFDLHGRKVSHSAAQKENAIPTHFSAGVYSVHVVLPDGKRETRKLVVR